MKLFVGLGNPGREYAKHRHNVGFMAIDQIADDHNFGPWKNRFQGLISDGRMAEDRVLLLKPQTYMNDSGLSVAKAARYLKIAPEDVVVFYDEIDLAAGKLKVKSGGGNAGHNGLRSITQHFGNDYQRVRIGVGHPGQKSQVANYVLSNFAKADHEWLDPLLRELSARASHLLQNKPDRFLSEVVQALQPEQPKKSKPADGSATNNRKRGEQGSSPSERRTDPAPSAKASPSDKPKSSSPLADGLKNWFGKKSD